MLGFLSWGQGGGHVGILGNGVMGRWGGGAMRVGIGWGMWDCGLLGKILLSAMMG